jgi:hypothetical protein
VRRDQPVPQSLHAAILFLRSVADLADTPTREAENPATGSARVHQVLRRAGAVEALWPAGVPEPVPALALPLNTPVLGKKVSPLMTLTMTWARWRCRR